MGKKQKIGKVEKRNSGRFKGAKDKNTGGRAEKESEPVVEDHSGVSTPNGDVYRGVPALREQSSVAQEHTPQGCVLGLSNLGNTCYLNSCVQTLLAAPVCREYFHRVKDSDKRSSGIKAGLGILFAATEGVPPADLPRRGKSSSTPALNPHVLYNALCHYAPQFKGRRQQDSHEALRILVDGLKCEIEKEHTFSRNGNCKVARAQRARESISDDNGEVGRENFVDSVFGGELSSCVHCETCHYDSVVTEPFLDLSLPIPDVVPTPKLKGDPRNALGEPSMGERADGQIQAVTAKQRKRLEKKARQGRKDKDAQPAGMDRATDQACGVRGPDRTSTSVTCEPCSDQGDTTAADAHSKVPESLAPSEKVESSDSTVLAPSETVPFVASQTVNMEILETEVAAMSLLDDSVASELGELENFESDAHGMPSLSTAMCQPAYPLQTLNVEGHGRQRGVPSDFNPLLSPSSPGAVKQIRKGSPALTSGHQEGFADSIDALYGGSNQASQDLSPRNRVARMEERLHRQSGGLDLGEGESAEACRGNGSCAECELHKEKSVDQVKDSPVEASPLNSSLSNCNGPSRNLKDPWTADDLQELTLQTCLAAFFSAEEISYCCPRSSEKHPSSLSDTSSDLGLISKGQTAPLKSRSGFGLSTQVVESSIAPAERPAPRRRRVWFSGQQPQVKYIGGSTEQRATDFRRAMEGLAFFRRAMVVDNLQILVKATLKRANYCLSPLGSGKKKNRITSCEGQQKQDQLILELKNENDWQRVDLPVLPMVDVGRIEDPDDEAEQEMVLLKATLLIDFVVDMADTFGLDVLHRLQGSNINLLPDPIHPNKWMVHCLDNENGVWKYPDHSTPPTLTEDENPPPWHVDRLATGDSLEGSSSDSCESANESQSDSDPFQDFFPPSVEDDSLDHLDVTSVAQATSLDQDLDQRHEGSHTNDSLNSRVDDEINPSTVGDKVVESIHGCSSTGGVHNSALGESDSFVDLTKMNLAVPEKLDIERDKRVSAESTGLVRSQCVSKEPKEKKVVESKAHRRYQIHRAPTLLVLHLKRFARTSKGSIQKINAHVPFPFDLDITKYTDAKDSREARYVLVGVVEHQGQLNGGHYVAYIQRGLLCDSGQSMQEARDRQSVGGAEIAVEVSRHDEAMDAAPGVKSPAKSADTIIPPAIVERSWEELLEDEESPPETSSKVAGSLCANSPSSSSNQGESVCSSHNGALQNRKDPTGSSGEAPHRQEDPSQSVGHAVSTGDGSRPQVYWEKVRAKKGPEPVSWYRASDTLVARVTEEAVAKCQAYLLLYMRV
eukprot:jgi/Botrbrau1/11596/Bobra.247_1s0016.4